MTKKPSSTSLNLAVNTVAYSSDHLNTLNDKQDNDHKVNRSDYSKNIHNEPGSLGGR